ncbi:hypothetical protein PENTCL1PPCAC_12426, partial [Pristionchus entomophagus]
TEGLLMVTMKEHLPDHHTSIYQVDDGTIFNWNRHAPHRLFVKLDGDEIDAVLPVERIECAASFGNALYFVAGGK